MAEQYGVHLASVRYGGDFDGRHHRLRPKNIRTNNAYLGSIAAHDASTHQAQQLKRWDNGTARLHDNINFVFGIRTSCSYQSACQRAPSTYINGGISCNATTLCPLCPCALVDLAPFSSHPLCTSDTPLSTYMGRIGEAEIMVGLRMRDPDEVELLLNAHSLF